MLDTEEWIIHDELRTICTQLSDNNYGFWKCHSTDAIDLLIKTAKEANDSEWLKNKNKQYCVVVASTRQ